MRIIYRNYWDDGTLTEDNEDASYPAENTQDIRLAKTWHTTEANSAHTIVIDAGTGATYTCNCAAIIHNNLATDAENSTYQIQANATDSWGTPSSATQITGRLNIMVVFFTSVTFRFWRFYIHDNLNPDDYLDVSRLFLGTYVQVDPSSLVEFPQKQVRNDRQMWSKSNQLYADQGVGWKELHYKFPRSTNAMKGSVETMWGSCGKFKPILMLNYDTTFTVIDPLYSSVVEDITFKHMKHDKWEYDLHLREVN